MYCIIRPTFTLSLETLNRFCSNNFYLGYDTNNIRTTILTEQEVNPALLNSKIQHYSNYMSWSKILKLLVDGEKFLSTESLVIKSLNYYVPPNISKMFGLIDPLELLLYVNYSPWLGHHSISDVLLFNRNFLINRLQFGVDDYRFIHTYNHDTLVQDLQTIIDNYNRDYIFYWNCCRSVD